MHAPRPVLFLCVMLMAQAVWAQENDGDRTGARVEILGTDVLEFDRTISGAQRLLGHVLLKHADALMRCDSAHLFEDQTVLAFGHVAIDQGDTLHITGDRLNYSGRERFATITGNVHLTDPGMELTTTALTYDLAGRTARYNTGATIVSRREQNTLTSRNGAYLAGAHRFIFSGAVQLRHPERTIDADTLHYTTTTGIAEFFGPTTITQGRTRMFCERGSYDTRKGRGRFTRAARIVDGAQELRGDSLHYDKSSGLGEAWGHVAVLDTTNDLLVRGNVGRHWQDDGRSMITGRAELVMLMNGDSLFLHADTLFASTDSLGGKRILARRSVRFFKSDMQGVCDTLTYAERDSLITMRGAPFLWSGADQISGRTVSITLRNGRAHRLLVERDGLLASSVDSTHFDQVSGLTITGEFDDDGLRRILAEGNSRTVYFVKEKDADDVERVTGMNRADCSRIDVRLAEGKVSTVSFITKPDAVMYPLESAPPDQMRMKGFVWNEDARPREKNDIFVPRE